MSREWLGSTSSMNQEDATCDAASAERCPIFPGVTTRLNWSFADPSGFTGSDQERLQKTIGVRDEIREKVRQWVEQEAKTETK